jgi:hypothetical protein
MVIQNSEVSMASKASFASGTKLTIQSETKPVFNLDDVQVIGGDGDFLSSLNYAKSPNGTVQEVGDTNPILSAASSRKIRLHTMEYLLKMLLLGGLWDEQSPFAQMFEQEMSETQNVETATSSEPLMYRRTDISFSYWQEQSVEFSSTGTAITADGRKLSFDYSFAMSESFTEQYDISRIDIANYVDPLVINLDDCPTSISPQTFFFDLDGDGEEDEIHNVGAGSGFLALDRNEDGVINDGLELFGARTGDGFRELELFDEDANGWIDENDPIFAKLRIMTINENGEKETYGLKQSDVGAIFLGRVGTEFVHHDDDNRSMAAVRKSGMFLHEKDGHAGGIQHVDFAT